MSERAKGKEAGPAYHGDPPATDNNSKDVNGDSNHALLKDPPIKCQQRELDTADDDRVGDL